MRKSRKVENTLAFAGLYIGSLIKNIFEEENNLKMKEKRYFCDWVDEKGYKIIKELLIAYFAPMIIITMLVILFVDSSALKNITKMELAEVISVMFVILETLILAIALYISKKHKKRDNKKTNHNLS